jgi:hypothetical protein
LDERSSKPVFTEVERLALADLAILCTADFWTKSAHLKRYSADDKHLFSIPKITTLALDIGYAEVEAVSYDLISDGLMKILEDSLRIMSIRTEPLQEYSYIFNAFQNQVINEIPNQILTPHAFIILHK